MKNAETQNDVFGALADLLLPVLPKDWQNVCLYAQINEMSYEFFFYVKINNVYTQCFDLEKSYGISRKEFREAFKAMYKVLLPEQKEKKWFAMTFLLSCDGKFSAEYEYEDYSENTLEYKELWKKKFLV